MTDRVRNRVFADRERRIYSLISRNEGLKAKDIAGRLRLEREDVNRELYASPLMRDLCYQDAGYRWHALIRQARPHEGLYEFSGWYGTAGEFMELSEDDFLAQLKEGCGRIGRNLNDQRGLFHSFRDCRNVIRRLFDDLEDMMGSAWREWECVFELRIRRGRMIRIYADVLMIITSEKVFSLEFKMKDRIDPEEVLQAAKYAPYLEIVFGEEYDIIPALVLTAASDLYGDAPAGNTDAVISVCSGDMLFNLFNDYLGFLTP